MGKQSHTQTCIDILDQQISKLHHRKTAMERVRADNLLVDMDLFASDTSTIAQLGAQILSLRKQRDTFNRRLTKPNR